MPYMSKKLCLNPRCGVRVDRGYCAEHESKRRQLSDGNRPGHGKHYSRKSWRLLRLEQLDQQPFCKAIRPDGSVCNALATEVDHIVPLSVGGTDDEDNLQSLCHSCHSRKTVKEDGGFGKRKRSA